MSKQLTARAVLPPESAAEATPSSEEMPALLDGRSSDMMHDESTAHL
jgi:hypothetical protein